MNRISSKATISSLADLELSSRGNFISVEDNSFIDSFVKFKFAGGKGNIEIGFDTYINSGTVIYSGHGVKIGNSVLIAANCTLAPVNHQFQSRDEYISKQGFLESRGGIIISDDVWIGCNSVILDGARINKGVVISAGSLVTKEMPEYSICKGVPAKVIGYRK